MSGERGPSRRPAIPNPYIVGNPIKDRKLFFGREDDFNFIQQKVTGAKEGGLLVLCGSRRSGKTSILFQIRGGRLGEGFVPVLIDMQSMTVRSDAEFLARLAGELLAAVGLSPEELTAEFDPQRTPNPSTAFQALIRRIEASLGGRKLVLLFDEYELFESHLEEGHLTEDVLNLLASWIERQSGVFIVFTGSDKLESRKTAYWERFLGKALHRRISFLSKTDTLRLIHEPVGDSVAYESAVDEQIYALTAGQPFYTQVICQSLIDHLNETGNQTVTGEDLEQVVGEIIENPLPQMIFSWNSRTMLERLCLSLVATLSPRPGQAVSPAAMLARAAKEKIPYRIDFGKLQEALERLFYRDLVEKDSAATGYFLKMDLWRRWITRMHSLWQVADEISNEDDGPGDGLLPGAPPGPTRHNALIGAVMAILAGAALVYYIQSRESPPELPAQVSPPAPRDSTHLSISTQPSGAAVFLGAKRIGHAPLSNARVPTGRLPLRLELAGYRDFVDTLDLKREERLVRRVTLSARTGDLRLTSDPPGAAVRLNGEEHELHTPCDLVGLPVARTHEIALALPGHESLQFVLRVFEDSLVTSHHVFARSTHILTLRSDPSGAAVRLDSRTVGRTPCILEAVTTGEHMVELRLEGYAPLRRAITIPVADNLMTVDLVRLPPGELVFQVEPYADIWIDGELHEEGGVYYTVTLAAGTHAVELRHPRYGSVTRTIQIEPGRTFTMQHRFGADGEEP